MQLRLEAAWTEGGYGPGQPLESPFCIEVGDWTVTGYWRNQKNTVIGNIRGVNSVDCWKWSDDFGDSEEDDGPPFFVDGSHEAMPVIPDELIEYTATEYA